MGLRGHQHFEMSAIDLHVGRQIRARREHLGVDRATLGQSAGCSAGNIRLIEEGVARAGADLLVRLAQVLGVKLSYFFEGFE